MVISVIGLLIALILPAVMNARETARRLQCANNLKQVVLAVNGHLNQKGFFPREEHTYSWVVFTLPFLEENNLFNSINLSKARINWPQVNDPNETAFTTQLSVFLCPSDSGRLTKYGATSYGGNYGVDYLESNQSLVGPFGSGLGLPGIRESWVRDGLSNTVAVSEYCLSSPTSVKDALHNIYNLHDYDSNQLQLMLKDCLVASVNYRELNPIDKGECWAFPSLGLTLYNHGLPPNHNTCSSKGAFRGAWSASSKHNGGVNCAHLDGHVSFVKSTINLSIWQGLGTIGGGEIAKGVQF